MAKKKYGNRFPNIVSGFGFYYRRPMAVPECEALSKRMAEIYNDWPLFDDDRALLLAMHSRLGPAQLAYEGGQTAALKKAERVLEEFASRVRAGETV